MPGAEVAVAPKRRKNPSTQSPGEGHTIAKAQLRLQDPDSRFIYKCEENGVEMDVVFTSGVFIHPETAVKYSFGSLQFVVISPRIVLKDGKKKSHTESSVEKEAKKANLNDKQGYHHVIVQVLFSDSVAKGHIMLSQSLRLYLGAAIHSCKLILCRVE